MLLVIIILIDETRILAKIRRNPKTDDRLGTSSKYTKHFLLALTLKFYRYLLSKRKVFGGALDRSTLFFFISTNYTGIFMTRISSFLASSIKVIAVSGQERL